MHKQGPRPRVFQRLVKDIAEAIENAPGAYASEISAALMLCQTQILNKVLDQLTDARKQLRRKQWQSARSRERV